jgi:ribonuclease HI
VHNEVVIKKVVTWVFFDGACQGLRHSLGLGFILHFSESHLVKLKLNLGRSTIDIGEFKAPFFLLKIHVHESVFYLQVFGDSKLVIDWMNWENLITNSSLQQMENQL